MNGPSPVGGAQAPASRLSPAFLGLLFAVGLAARLAAIGLGIAPMVSDSSGYWEPARSLAEGRGYLWDGKPGAYRPPTYPIFLALVILGTGANPHRAVLIQAVVTSTVGVILAVWLARCGAPKGAAAAAGLLVTLDPLLVAASGLILTEAFGALLLTALIVTLQGAIAHPTWTRWTCVGFLAGALALNTLNTLFLFLFLFVWLVLWRRPARALLGWGLAAVLLLGCIGAWSVRNRLVLGNAMPLRSTGFTSLIWGMTEYDFNWVPEPGTREYEALQRRFEEISGGRDLNDLHQVQGDFLRAAWKNVREHPVRVLWRVVKGNFWFWVEIPGAVLVLRPHPGLRWSLLMLHLVQLFAFALGVLFLARRGAPDYALLGLGGVAYFALSLMLLFPIPRYYVPVLPMMDMIAAIGLTGWWQRRAAIASPGVA